MTEHHAMLAIQRERMARARGQTVHSLDSNYWQEIGNELRRLGCTGVQVSGLGVSYARPPRNHLLLQDFPGYLIDWIIVAKRNIASRQ